MRRPDIKINRIFPEHDSNTPDVSTKVDLCSTVFSEPGVVLTKAMRGSLPATRPRFVRPQLPWIKSHQNTENVGMKRWFMDAYVAARRQRTQQSCRNPSKAIDFLSLIDVDDENFDDHVEDLLAGKLIDSSLFRHCILFLICTNSLMILLQTIPELASNFGRLFQMMDQFFLTAFVFEIMIKWFHGFRIFWHDFFNIFDFSIVMVSFLGNQVFQNASMVKVLRTLRALRSVKFIKRLEGLRMIMSTLLSSLSNMVPVLFYIILLIFIASVLSVFILEEYVPKHFGSLETAMFSYYILITLDGWVEVFEDTIEAIGDEGISMLLVLILFFIFIFLGAFVFVNMVVGILVTNLQVAFEERNKTAKRSLRDLKASQSNTMPRNVSVQEVGPSLIKGATANQKPLEIPDMTQLSAPKVHSYFLLLAAIQDNLDEFQKLRMQIHDVVIQASSMNEEDEDSYNMISPANSVYDVSETKAETEPTSEKNPTNGKMGDTMSILLAGGSNAENIIKNMHHHHKHSGPTTSFGDIAGSLRRSSRALASGTTSRHHSIVSTSAGRSPDTSRAKPRFSRANALGNTHGSSRGSLVTGMSPPPLHRAGSASGPSRSHLTRSATNRSWDQGHRRTARASPEASSSPQGPSSPTLHRAQGGLVRSVLGNKPDQKLPD